MKTQLSKPDIKSPRNWATGRALMGAPLFDFRFNGFAPLRLCVILVVAIVLASATAHAANTNDITSLVQRGLFEEEANHNLDAAMQSYETAIKLHDKDRKLAATAIFRLGECYRKQGKTDLANEQYRRILSEFADQTELAELSKGYLPQPVEDNPQAIAAYKIQRKYDALVSALSKAEQNERQLSAQYTDSNPLLREARSKRAKAQKELDQLLSDHPELATNSTQLDRKLKTGDVVSITVGGHPELNKVSIVNDRGGISFAGIHGIDVGGRTVRDAEKEIRNVVAASKKAEGSQVTVEFAWAPETVSDQPRDTGPSDAARAKLLQLSVETAQAEALWSHVSKLNGSELAKFFTTIQPDPTLINLESQVEEALSKLRAIESTMGTTHPEYITAKNVANSLYDQIDRRVADLKWSVEQKYKMLKDQEDALKKRIDQSGSSVAKATESPTTSEEDEEIRKIKEMIQNSPDLINVAANSDEGTPLQQASIKGHVKVAEFLLANGANINIRTDKVSPPLICAAVHGHKALIDLLLSKGADIEIQSTGTYNNQTALMCAAHRGFKTIVQTLLAHGANVNATDSVGRTALHHAAENGYGEIIELLIPKGANVNATDRDGNTPLHLAIGHKNKDIIGMLLANRARVDIANVGGYTALNMAAVSGEADVIANLIERGADVNSKAHGGYTPLLSAAKYNSVETAKILLEHGANIEAQVDSSGQDPFDNFRPLSFAIHQSNTNMLALLLDHKADPNAKINWMQNVSYYPRPLVETSPLRAALGRNHSVDMMRLLLEHGADPNVPDASGDTILGLAVGNLSTPVVKLLLEYHADVNAVNKNGLPPIAYVMNPQPTPDQRAVAEILRKAGASENFVRLKQISVGRNGNHQVVFTRGTNDWNRYTLFELLGIVYENHQQFALRAIPPRPIYPSAGTFAPSPLPVEMREGVNYNFPFPDLYRVTIDRLLANGTHRTIPVNVAGNLSGASPADMPLEWGDIVEIPEEDHSLSATWGGLPTETISHLYQALHRSVFIVMKHGPETKKVVELGDKGPHFRLSEVINDTGVLRSSSDPSRIKVSHNDNRSITFDLTNAGSPDEPWLKNTDTIEIPDRDTAAVTPKGGD